MSLIDFFIKIGAKQVDSRNLIRNALVGFAKEDKPETVLALIDLIISEAADAQKIIRECYG